MTAGISATVTLGPKKLLGKGVKYADIYIAKPRSAVSERALSYSVEPTPDGRYALSFRYCSGSSFGATNKGTLSGRAYFRNKTVAADEVIVRDSDGRTIERYGREDREE